MKTIQYRDVKVNNLFMDDPAGYWYVKLNATTAQRRINGVWTIEYFDYDTLVYID